jgi:AraC-like DNA-binding protein
MNRCSFPREPVSACGIELLTTWQVKAGRSYSIPAEQSREDSHARLNQAGRELVALRTWDGEGCLCCEGREHTLPSGSLVVFKYSGLESYCTMRSPWAFWWFEFRPAEPFLLPLDQVMLTRSAVGENDACADVSRDLRSEVLALRCRASARLQSLLFGWWGTSDQQQEGDSRERAKVQHVIEQMHANPEKPWTLPQMAASAGMCESSLRAAFCQTIGKPPVRVRNELRLSHAYELLRCGDSTVAEVADRMGYCDPFHFSKVFKAEYGIPPTHFLRGRLDRAGSHNSSRRGQSRRQAVTRIKTSDP